MTKGACSHVRPPATRLAVAARGAHSPSLRETARPGQRPHPAADDIRRVNVDRGLLGSRGVVGLRAAHQNE